MMIKKHDDEKGIRTRFLTCVSEKKCLNPAEKHPGKNTLREYSVLAN